MVLVTERDRQTDREQGEGGETEQGEGGDISKCLFTYRPLAHYKECTNKYHSQLHTHTHA